jgi:hypothetical protein
VLDRRPIPDGVGVNGGGFIGDSVVVVALRFLGRGVVGPGESVLDSTDPLTVSFTSLLAVSSVVVDALVLRFFVAGAGLATFSYFATPFPDFASDIAGVILLATLAERRRDMFSGCGLPMLIVRVKEKI